jgi:hypothetical protein
MNRTFLCLSLLIAAHGFTAAQSLTFRCVRDIDGQPLTPDSILIVSETLNLRTVITGSQIDLAATSVDEDVKGARSTVTGRIDQYDLQGRWLDQRTGRLERAALRLDAHLGAIIEVPSDARRRAMPTSIAGHVLSADEISITAFREAYYPTSITIPIPKSDGEVELVLQLLPWWKRLKGLGVFVVDSNAYNDHRSTLGASFTARGGDLEGWIIEECTSKWTQSGASLNYHCQYDVGVKTGLLDLYLRVDTTTGAIDSLQYGRVWTAGTNYGKDTMRLRDLPVATELSTDSMYLEINNPDICDRFLWAYNTVNYTAISPDGKQQRNVTETSYGSGRGTECRARLRMWIGLKE